MSVVLILIFNIHPYIYSQLSLLTLGTGSKIAGEVVDRMKFVCKGAGFLAYPIFKKIILF